MSAEAAGFHRNVFVNCPFDSDYDPLLKALLFAVTSLGFDPRIASERADSGEQRVTKICELIGESRFSIHDLSRLKSSARDEFFRMNMPFELGVDYGCRSFGRNGHREKRFLILETRRYESMKALSDLSGVDVQAHQDSIRVLIRKVRNWFSSTVGLRDLDSPTKVLWDFNRFYADLYDHLKAEDFSDADIEELPVTEYLDHVQRWMETR